MKARPAPNFAYVSTTTRNLFGIISQVFRWLNILIFLATQLIILNAYKLLIIFHPPVNVKVMKLIGFPTFRPTVGLNIDLRPLNDLNFKIQIIIFFTWFHLRPQLFSTPCVVLLYEFLPSLICSMVMVDIGLYYITACFFSHHWP